MCTPPRGRFQHRRAPTPVVARHHAAHATIRAAMPGLRIPTLEHGSRIAREHVVDDAGHPVADVIAIVR
jgi:hypothetical protein